MSITIELPVDKAFLEKVGLTPKKLWEIILKYIKAEYVLKKIETDIEKYKDILPQDDEEVMNLITQLENE